MKTPSSAVPALFLVALSVALVVSCEFLPTEGTPNLEHGTLRFAFSGTGATSPSSTPGVQGQAPLPEGLKSVIVSATDEEGALVFDKEEIPLIQFGDGYLSEGRSLSAGTYFLTEFLIVDADFVARFASPVEGSEHSQEVTDPLPMQFSISPETAATLHVEVIEIPEDSQPSDFGYLDFSPIWVVAPFTFSVAAAREEADGSLTYIPFGIQYKSVKRPPNGNGGSSHSYDRYIPRLGPNIIESYVDGPGYEFKVQVRSPGHRTSETYEFTSEGLFAHRFKTPTITIVLEPEITTVKLENNGVNGGGLTEYLASIVESERIAEIISSTGATESDIYSYTLGFQLYAAIPNPSPYAPPGSKTISVIAPTTSNPQHVFVPYNPNLIQHRDDYKTLEATISLDSEQLAKFENPDAEKYLLVYFEVLILRGDGADPAIIDGDEAFVGFESGSLTLDMTQVEIQ